MDVACAIIAATPTAHIYPTRETPPPIIFAIGSGSSSTVYRCVGESESAVIKVIKREQLYIGKNELNIGVFLQTHEHPNIIKFIGHVMDRSLYLVFEFAGDMDAFTYFDSQPNKIIPYELQSSFITQLCGGVAFLHSIGIIHRDIKPENIVISANHGELNIKIIDFGFAVMFDKLKNSIITGMICGSKDYMPPELLSHLVHHPKTVITYDGAAADMWCVGVVIYVISHGVMPFSRKAVARQLLKKQTFILAESEPIESTPVYSKCLIFQPEGRVSASDASDIAEMLLFD